MILSPIRQDTRTPPRRQDDRRSANRSTLGLLVTTLGWLSLIGLNASSAATRVHHRDNGVWLGHAYVKAQSYVDNVGTLAQDMKDNYSVLYWFVNVGKVNVSSGGSNSEGTAFFSLRSRTIGFKKFSFLAQIYLTSGKIFGSQ